MSRTLGLALALVVGCSGSGIPEEQFCADHAEVECRTLADWCGFPGDACQAARQNACEMRVQTLRGGSHLYDKQAAAGCIAALARGYRAQPIPIASLREIQAACERVYHGNSDVGEGCRSGIDCRQGLACQGRCVREVLVPADGPCDQPGQRCPDGHYCASLSGGAGRNTPRVCRPAMELGQSCAVQPCQDQLRCQDMVCINRLPLEAECERDLDCAPPAAYCNPYTGLCADRVSFTPGSVSCQAQAGF